MNPVLRRSRVWPFVGRWAASILVFVAASAVADPELTAAGAAIATGSDLLETAIVVERLEPPERPGQRGGRFVPASRLEAGDEVYYTLRVTNPGKSPVTDVQVTKRLPQGLQFISGSAAGPSSIVEFSSDGGASFLAKPKSAEFTHVRWTLRRPLPAGATALLRFRATFH